MKKLSMSTIVLAIAVVVTGLIAGLFYAYSVSVTGALGRLTDVEYMRAMQSINLVILNPLFFASFFGALIFLPWSTFLWYNASVTPRFLFLLGASIVYAVGVFGVTAVANVPLNEALAKFDIEHATTETLAAARQQFEKPWNAYNNVRTLAAIASLVLVALACVAGGGEQEPG